jgi:hypothetical protein
MMISRGMRKTGDSFVWDAFVFYGFFFWWLRDCEF